jgi:hypothetical protein
VATIARSLGDFLTQAQGHITATVSIQGELPDKARNGMIGELDFLVTILEHNQLGVDGHRAGHATPAMLWFATLASRAGVVPPSAVGWLGIGQDQSLQP